MLQRRIMLENHQAAIVIIVAMYLAATITTLIRYDLLIATLTRGLIVLFAVLVYMTLVFYIAQRLKRMDIVDAAWGGGFVVAALVSFGLNPYGLTVGWNVQTIVSALVIVWAIRLAFHILRRLVRKPEDPRYKALQKQWADHPRLNAYVRVFLLQGLLATAISAAIIHVNGAPLAMPGAFTLLGIGIWLVGFFFEAIGDWQLKQYLAQVANKGKLMTRGLWRYTRHPNYFGEAAMWWGIVVIALDTSLGWMGVISPILITYLLLFVSGVPLTEKAFAGRPGWDDYRQRTSKFLPLPPRT